jgi:hypothetical protein
MPRILRPGGNFYLAVPVGRPRVEFNANRVFDPADILFECRALGLELLELHLHTSLAGRRRELAHLLRQVTEQVEGAGPQHAVPVVDARQLEGVLHHAVHAVAADEDLRGDLAHLGGHAVEQRDHLGERAHPGQG